MFSLTETPIETHRPRCLKGACCACRLWVRCSCHSELAAEPVTLVVRGYGSDYAASLVAESESDYPPSVGGECALGTDVFEGRQEEFECLAAAVPHLVAMLLAPEGDPDAPDIPTPRSYIEAITGPYSS
ncbi:unnamed protein product [Closterium sp. NIES-54]